MFVLLRSCIVLGTVLFDHALIFVKSVRFASIIHGPRLNRLPGSFLFDSGNSGLIILVISSILFRIILVVLVFASL
jgi:hypothetical protein